MNNLKRMFLTAILALAILVLMPIVANAATVEITGEVVNVRKEASTSSKVVAQLSEGVECEYLGQEGEWYKVKYQSYTGYVSKEYTKLVGEVANTTEPEAKPNNDDKDNNSDNTNNQDAKPNDNQANNTTSNDNSDGKNETKLVYKKFKQSTIIRILPLIYSGNIGEAKKNDEVLILTELSGWTYVQTDTLSGWVRTDTLGEAKTVTSGSSSQGNEPVNTEKVGYISEEEVNMRKGAGTSYSIIKVLKLNNQVTIIGQEGNWYQVKSGNDTGFVSKDYVSDSKTVTNRNLSEPRTEKQEEKKEDKATTTSDKNTTTDNKNSSNTTSNKDTSTTTNTTSNKVTATTTGSKNTIKSTDVISYAKKFLGYKYVWGGASTKGFDCSGFSMYVYKHFGVSLPHYTVSQYNSGKGKKITKQSDLKMGDIVFLTDYVTGAACGHCGIYIENGKFIHADSSVGHVNISDLNGIYKGRFCGALRVNGVEN